MLFLVLYCLETIGHLTSSLDMSLFHLNSRSDNITVKQIPSPLNSLALGSPLSYICEKLFVLHRKPCRLAHRGAEFNGFVGKDCPQRV